MNELVQGVVQECLYLKWAAGSILLRQEFEAESPPRSCQLYNIFVTSQNGFLARLGIECGVEGYIRWRRFLFILDPFGVKGKPDNFRVKSL